MEDTRKIAAEYRLSRWAEVMQRRQVSGRSIKGFCQLEGIHQNTYFYWQRKLRESACKVLPNKNSELMIKPQNGVANADKSVVPSGWTQITETAAQITVESSIVIEICGCRITVSSETDPELLIKVCRTLRTL